MASTILPSSPKTEQTFSSTDVLTAVVTTSETILDCTSISVYGLTAFPTEVRSCMHSSVKYVPRSPTSLPVSYAQWTTKVPPSSRYTGKPKELRRAEIGLPKSKHKEDPWHSTKRQVPEANSRCTAKSLQDGIGESEDCLRKGG